MAARWGKYLAGVLVVIALVYVGSTWWVGKQIERHYHNASYWQLPSSIQAVLQERELAIELLPGEFKRGVFSSTAAFSARSYSGETALPTVFWQQEIAHGPWPLARLLRLQWLPVLATGAMGLDTDKMRSALAEYLPEGWQNELSKALSLTYKVAFDGATKVRFGAQALMLESNGSRWQSQPAWIHADIDAEGRLTSFDANINQFVVVAEQWLPQFSLQLEVQKLVASMQQSSLRNNRLQYDNHTSVALLNVHLHDEQENNTVEVELAELDSQQHSTFTLSPRGVVIEEANTKGSLGELMINGRRLGSLTMQWAAENVDVGALTELGNLADDKASTFDALLTAILSPKPKLELQQLAWQNSAGSANMAIFAHAEPNDLLAPELGVLPKLRAQAELVFDGPMLQQVAQDIDAITSQYRDTSDAPNNLVESLAMYEVWLGELVSLNMLQQEDERYRLDVEVELEQGLRMFLNGYDVTESELMASWFMLMLLFSGAAP